MVITPGIRTRSRPATPVSERQTAHSSTQRRTSGSTYNAEKSRVEGVVNAKPPIPESILPSNLDEKQYKISVDNPYLVLKHYSPGLFSDNKQYHRGEILFPINSPNDKKPDVGLIILARNAYDSIPFILANKEVLPLKEVIARTSKIIGLDFDGSDKQLKEIMANKALINRMLRALPKALIPETVRRNQEPLKLLESSSEVHHDGIVFDSLDDLAKALKVFNKNSTVEKAFRKNNTAFTNHIIDEIKAKGGNYDKSFDYTGNAFQKTHIIVEPLNGKFILKINSVYNDKGSEDRLASELKKDRVLTEYKNTYSLSSTNQEGWISIDLSNLFSDHHLKSERLEKLAKVSAGEIKSSDLPILEVGGILVTVSVSLGQENKYHPEIHRIGSKLFFKPEIKGSHNPYSDCLASDLHGDSQMSIAVRPVPTMYNPKDIAMLDRFQKQFDTEVKAKLAT